MQLKPNEVILKAPVPLRVKLIESLKRNEIFTCTLGQYADIVSEAIVNDTADVIYRVF